MKKFFSIALLAALGFSLTASDAQAFGGRRKKNKQCAPVAVNTGCGGCGSTAYPTPVAYGANYATPMYAAAPCGGVTYGTVGVVNGVASAPVAMPSTGTGTAALTADKPATITVMVPSTDAQVWIDDTLATQTGKERTLTTGNLASGKSYDYVVKAKWTDDNGKKMEKTKTVTVKAGQTSTADFR